MRKINATALMNVLNRMYKKPKDSEDYMTIGYNHGIADALTTASKQPALEEPAWIPVKTHECTDEEREMYGEEVTVIFDCEMPDDNQDILVTTSRGRVEEDVNYIEDGYFLDSDRNWFEDIIAWMPKPKPYKEKKNETCGC